MSLVVLDPLTAVLVGLLRRNGIWLAGGVTVLDVCANWIGNWQWVQDDPTRLLRPVGLLPITLFGLFVIAFLVPLHLTVTRTVGRSGPRCRPGGDSRVPGVLGTVHASDQAGPVTSRFADLVRRFLVHAWSTRTDAQRDRARSR
ncbi:hypothetical protein HEP87_60515 [Streptomyces sp. S1D4-11]|nr:hypothetical protein [Streptomyces sp. S1D4-11]